MAGAVQRVVRTKRHHVTTWQYVMRTTLHQLTNVKIIGIKKARDRDPHQVFGGGLLSQHAGKEAIEHRIHAFE